MVATGKLLNPSQAGREAEDLEVGLRRRIIGQDDAIRQILRVYQTQLAGLSSPGRPLGVLLFLGPTGSGKTRMVEAVAECLVGDERAVIKVDCGEFQHSHEIAKLIGSPPGYLGHRETHALLSQETLNRCHTDRVKLSFVLFDEIEKASDALWNLLLGVLDRATLTTGDNKRVDFSRTFIFMTGNLGAAEMSDILSPRLGFASFGGEKHCLTGDWDPALADKLSRAAVDAAQRKFTPEFMNRIDRTVVFRPLGTTELRKILELELNLVQRRVFESPEAAPFVLSFTESAKDLLLSEGTDMKYGARRLKRVVDQRVVHPLSNLIASGQVRGGDLVRVDHQSTDTDLLFRREFEGMPLPAMVSLVDASALPSPTSYRAAGADPVNLSNVRMIRR